MAHDERCWRKRAVGQLTIRRILSCQNSKDGLDETAANKDVYILVANVVAFVQRRDDDGELRYHPFTRA